MLLAVRLPLAPSFASAGPYVIGVEYERIFSVPEVDDESQHRFVPLRKFPAPEIFNHFRSELMKVSLFVIHSEWVPTIRVSFFKKKKDSIEAGNRLLRDARPAPLSTSHDPSPSSSSCNVQST